MREEGRVEDQLQMEDSEFDGEKEVRKERRRIVAEEEKIHKLLGSCNLKKLETSFGTHGFWLVIQQGLSWFYFDFKGQKESSEYTGLDGSRAGRVVRGERVAVAVRVKAAVHQRNSSKDPLRLTRSQADSSGVVLVAYHSGQVVEAEEKENGTSRWRI